MKVTLENTSRIVTINGIPARIWEGTTESGIRVYAAITRVAVHKDDDNSQFEKELIEEKTPSPEAMISFPLRAVL